MLWMWLKNRPALLGGTSGLQMPVDVSTASLCPCKTAGDELLYLWTVFGGYVLKVKWCPLNCTCEKVTVCKHILSREPHKVEGQVRPDYSPAPTQLALLSPICFTDLKGRELATRRNPR